MRRKLKLREKDEQEETWEDEIRGTSLDSITYAFTNTSSIPYTNQYIDHYLLTGITHYQIHNILM